MTKDLPVPTFGSRASEAAPSTPWLTICGFGPIVMFADHGRTVVDVGAGNADAVFMSATILSRGAQALTWAWLGIGRMWAGECLLEGRAILEYGTARDLLRIERELAPIKLARAFRRICLLHCMAVQVGDDAGYPLYHRFGVALSAFQKSLGAGPVSA